MRLLIRLCAVLVLPLLGCLLLPPLGRAAGPTTVQPWKPRPTAADSTVDFGAFRITPLESDTVRVPVRMLLSWNAPHGHPRASTDLTYAPGDTSGADTLYVSFDPVMDHPKFVGFMATLYLRPVEGDTLGRFWKYTSGKGQRPIARVEMPDSTQLGTPPWTMQPAWGARYEHMPTSAEIKVLGAVNPLADTPIKGGTLYTLARIILRRPDGADPQELKPLCFEFASLLLTFTLQKDGEQTHKSGEQRFVAYRDPQRAACGPALPLPERAKIDKPARRANAPRSRGR